MTRGRRFILMMAAALFLGVLGQQAPISHAGPRAPASTSPANLSQTLQHVLDATRKSLDIPGASVTILRDGQPIWQGFSGQANLSTNQQVSAQTLFSLASCTKTYVATMVLRLMEEGKLHIDDPIAGYVPSYIPSIHIVTIKNLLGHTSGYPDIENTQQFLRWARDPNHQWTQASLFHMIEPSHFKPGSRFEYSNTNYLLLAAVIDHASGSNVGEEFERLILSPVGLHQTFFERLPRVAAHFAHGYIPTRHGLYDTFTGAHRDGVPTNVWGTIWTDGGIATTSGDLAAFTNALYGGHILQPTTLALMEKPGPDGSYGLGTYRMGFDAHAWQGHDGAYDGFESYAFYDISRHLTVIAVINFDTFGPGYPVQTLWQNITRTYDHTTQNG